MKTTRQVINEWLNAISGTSLEEFAKAHYKPVFDDKLELTGWEEKELHTLEDVKNAYYTELTGNSITMGFEQYIRDHCTQVYDANLGFIGWEIIK